MFLKALVGSVGTCAVLAGTAVAGIHGQAATEVSIDELRALCHQHRNHEQIREGSVYYKCKVEKEFWRHTGTVDFALPNKGKLKVKAYIKDQRYSTDFWSVPFEVSDQAGKCEEYEQWKATTMYAEPGTCELLDRIAVAGSEDAYCRQVLQESGKIPSRDEAIRQILQRPDQVEEIVRGTSDSIFGRTGEVRSCTMPDNPRQQDPRQQK